MIKLILSSFCHLVEQFNQQVNTLFYKIFVFLTFILFLTNIVNAQPNPIILETGFDCSKDGKLKVTFVSVVDNDQNDSWDDDISPGVILKVSGTNVFEATYTTNGSDGELSSTKKADGVTHSEVTDASLGDAQSKKLIVIVPLSYLKNGTNDINISGTWKERKSGGSDSRHQINETQQVSIVLPEPVTGASSTIDENGMVTLTWSNPSGDFSGVQVLRNNVWQWATTNKSVTSWTDNSANMTQETYSIVAFADHPSCTGKHSFSSKVNVNPPAPPKVSKPAGLTATTDRCDGKILVSWDYTGDVEPTNFVLNDGASDINIPGDKREYLHDVGEFASRTYTIYAEGPINQSSPTSEVTGSSQGLPSAPSSFGASRSGNDVRLYWGASSNHSGYLIKRNSASGAAEFDVEASKTSFMDRTVNGCEQYTYEIYAKNACSDEAAIAGVKASNSPSIRLDPYLGSYITFMDASKAYYSDKVIIEWNVQSDNLGLVDKFEVWRRKAGTGSYTIIGTVEGKSIFEDFSALGGELYEYRVVARLQCDDDNLSSNQRTAVGFRIPYGIVNGNIRYENGVNVKGVEVMAEKSADAIGTSLYFDGNDYVSVNNDVKLNPSNFITTEAWIRPQTLKNADIISKYDYSNGYRLYQENADAVFTVKINGTFRMVRAQNAFKAGEFTHVAGVYDSTGLKIFINGKVPEDVTYVIGNDDIQYLLDAGHSQQVVDLLAGMVNVPYSNYDNFRDDVIAAMDSALAMSTLPLLTPLAKQSEYQYGTVMDLLSGNIANTSGQLRLGENFHGYIDEIRIWSKARDEETIFYDYKRVVGNDANGIAAYWRCDENFGNMIYDASKSKGEHHKNDGQFYGTTWSDVIPNRSLLGWMGKTDAMGNYTIPYIPYFGSGENFTLTPRYEQHQFEPTAKTVFLGEGSTILSAQDFTDISSFKVTGIVFYEGTNCGVEGAILTIDGEPVIKNGKPIYTDQYGEFEIAVPVGNHYISVEKSRHNFLSYKFPPGPEDVTFNFQEPINGINFIDQTTVTVVGRVVGGTREGSKKPGLGLSKNNIGVASFKLKSAVACSEYLVETDVETGEFRVELPPMKYIPDLDNLVPKNPAVELYFSSVPEADFSIVNEPIPVSHTFNEVVNMTVSIDTVVGQVTLDIEGEPELVVIEDLQILDNGQRARFYYQEQAYEYALSQSTNPTVVTEEIDGNGTTVSTDYNYRYDLIYRATPEIRITAADGKSSFSGDKVVRFEDPISRTMKEFNTDQYPFQYPMFTQGVEYGLNIFAEEVYFNQDTCAGINGCPEAREDRVLVNDGDVVINNQLAANKGPAPIPMQEGKAVYTFKAGQPQVLQDANFPWRSYSGVFNISVRIDNVLYDWEPYPNKESLGFSYPLSTIHPDDKFFRGYVLGVNPIEGSDFITEGPQMVDMILRDPPGSESYSYIESGSSFSYEESFSMASSVNNSYSMSLSLGAEFETGIGYSQETSITADLEAGISVATTSGAEGSLEKTVTINDYYETSSSPELAGAPSDLFFGSSINYAVSLADNLTIFPVDFANNNGLPTAGLEAGPDGEKFKIGLNKSLMAAPDGSPTFFIFTQDHIENYLIPNLVNVRNNLFINDAKYQSKIGFSHPLYGSNNDDNGWGESATSTNPFSTTQADYDGPSYTFTPESEEDRDQVRKLNEQIRLWEAALERNEMEKYSAALVKNISFDAGPTFEHSTETSITTAHSSTFELDLSLELAAAIGFEVGGIGSSREYGLAINRNTGHTTTTTNTQTNTFGYVLHDPDQGDYFSVDVKDPQTGTGPVFAIKGGRSMCPHEKAAPLKYYIPAKYRIDDAMITELALLNASHDFLDILQRIEPTGEYSLDELSADFNIASVILENMPEGAKFQVPQIRERQFKRRFELEEAVLQIINLHLNLSDNPDLADDFSKNMDELDPNTAGDLAGNLEADEESGGNKIYVFTPEQRENMHKEWLRYSLQIYEMSGTPLNNAGALDVSTIRREVPVASISPAVQENVPEDNVAYFTLSLGNNSYTDETMWYEARIIEASNPDGAVISIDDNDVQRAYEIAPGEIINKTLAVGMGRDDVYKYDSLQIVFYAKCEYEFYTNGRSMDPEAVDTVTFSVHYVPSCTDVTVAKPVDDYIINSEDEHLVEGVKETKVPILLTEYNLENIIFDKMEFQFKADANPQWIVPTDFYLVPEDGQNGIPGDFTALEWDLSGYPDGVYNIRAKTYCGNTPEGAEIFDLSEVWTGVVDRKPPQVFGSPQPADGVLSPDDDIILEYNETIFTEKLTKLANFDIRGILNGTDLRHDVSVGFDDDPENFIRIPDGISLGGKSFTVEFWLKLNRAYEQECIVSQATNPEDAIMIRTSNEGYFEFQVGDQVYEEDNLSTADILGEWHHFAFVYDHVRSEIITMMDGTPLGSGSVSANYEGFGDIYIGKALFGDNRTLQGNLHELRIWERPRTASQITANMLITLSGKETGLAGYWPLDDAYGTLAADKVHKRNATVNSYWDITPSGYAATFNGGSQGVIDMNFSDIAFTPEEDFSIEFWFKGDNGSNQCLLSNGHGDNNDVILYYISMEGLANIVKVLPLEDSVEIKLDPMVNNIYGDEDDFLSDVGLYLGLGKEQQYKEQLLRFAKHMPTYWCINTDANGNLQVSNNGKRIKYSDENYFDNRWHHFALVVERIGNTRVFVDGELKLSEPSSEWNGFGAARLFVGARGLFNQAIPGFIFDQHFSGSIDELRIWSTVLRQSQIQRNSNMRLDGNELALVSYFPFESYEELMGVPVVNGLLEDVISDREELTNTGVNAQNTDVPNVRMKRPSSKVDFNFVARPDEIAFEINEPIAKIENCILDITARNVEDLYGNKMSSPVTWSAFVDMNQVKWTAQQYDLEKKIYDPLTFKATIRNSSGQQQNFSIENLPGWLTASPQSGTMEPLTDQEIVFTVNEGLNIGSYSRNLHLQTDFDFDEKLMLNLRVYENLPDDWEVNANDYEYSMNVIGKITINNVVSTDRYDKVAAFVDGECRGIAYLHYVPEYDMYEVFMDIYSNEVNGEYFELHLWDASEGREYRKVTAGGLHEAPVPFTGLYEFLDNTIYGSPSAPVNLEANSVIIKKIPLQKGWNWRSFNIEMDVSKPLTQQLEGINAINGDLVKGLTSYSEFNEYWIGTLNYLNSEEMYMFNMQQRDTLKVSGSAVKPEETPIDIVSGWNWIGFTPQVNIQVNDALGLFNPNHGDLIKSQYAFAMYDQLMGWVGTLEYLRPHEGYKYKYLPQGSAPLTQQLFYPLEGTILGARQQESLPKTIPGYQQYEHNMAIIAQLENHESSGTIEVYQNTEIRGMGEPVQLSDGRQLYFLTCYGNQPNDSVSFRLQTESGNKLKINESVLFKPGNPAGTVDEPLQLTLAGELQLPENENVSYQAYPNPFKDEITIIFSQPEEDLVQVQIINVMGDVVMNLEKTSTRKYHRVLNTSHLQAGMYFIRFQSNGNVYFEKIIKK